MPNLNAESRAYLEPLLSRVSGPPRLGGGSWGTTAGFEQGGIDGAVELRRLIVIADAQEDLKRLIARGDTSLIRLSWEPGRGTTGPNNPPAQITLPGNTPTGIGFFLAVSIGEFIGTALANAQREFQEKIDAGEPVTKQLEDERIAITAMAATLSALAVLPQRIADRTMRKKTSDGPRVKIHGFSRRAGQ